MALEESNGEKDGEGTIVVETWGKASKSEWSKWRVVVGLGGGREVESTDASPV